MRRLLAILLLSASACRGQTTPTRLTDAGAAEPPKDPTAGIKNHPEVAILDCDSSRAFGSPKVSDKPWTDFTVLPDEQTAFFAPAGGSATAKAEARRLRVTIRDDGGAFGAGAELFTNVAGAMERPSVTADALKLFVAVGGDMSVAVRPSTDVGFGDPASVIQGASPYVSPDGSAVYFKAQDRIYRAVPTPDGPASVERIF